MQLILGVTDKLPYLDQYDGQNFSAMHCLLILERKWFYEVSRAFVPVVAISFLNCLTFGLPAGSGERVTMCISIFLAYIFMLNTLTDLQPRTSDGISILGIYMNFQLVSSILTTTFSILSLHTYHHGSLLEYIKNNLQMSKYICCEGLYEGRCYIERDQC